jgi:hypothetical protein
VQSGAGSYGLVLEFLLSISTIGGDAIGLRRAAVSRPTLSVRPVRVAMSRNGLRSASPAWVTM